MRESRIQLGSSEGCTEPKGPTCVCFYKSSRFLNVTHREQLQEEESLWFLCPWPVWWGDACYPCSAGMHTTAWKCPTRHTPRTGFIAQGFCTKNSKWSLPTPQKKKSKPFKMILWHNRSLAIKIWLLQTEPQRNNTCWTPLVSKNVPCYPDTQKNLNLSSDWRDGSAVKAAYCSCRGAEFNFQHSLWVAHNCLWLWLCRIQMHALVSTQHMHVNKTWK